MNLVDYYTQYIYSILCEQPRHTHTHREKARGLRIGVAVAVDICLQRRWQNIRILCVFCAFERNNVTQIVFYLNRALEIK